MEVEFRERHEVEVTPTGFTYRCYCLVDLWVIDRWTPDEVKLLREIPHQEGYHIAITVTVRPVTGYENVDNYYPTYWRRREFWLDRPLHGAALKTLAIECLMKEDRERRLARRR